MRWELDASTTEFINAESPTTLKFFNKNTSWVKNNSTHLHQYILPEDDVKSTNNNIAPWDNL
jgi:hypothetical protein